MQNNAPRKVIHWDYPDYFIWEDGTVERRTDGLKTVKAGRLLRGNISKGYRAFRLIHRDGGVKQIRANRLICEAFHGLAPSKAHEAAHDDGVKLNNHESNLYWATSKQNKADSIRHGTHARGTASVVSKLTEEKVAEARRLYDGCHGSVAKLARKYGVSYTGMRDALTGKRWAHVSEPLRATMFHGAIP